MVLENPTTFYLVIGSDDDQLDFTHSTVRRGLRNGVYGRRFTEGGLRKEVYGTGFTERGLRNEVYGTRFTERGLRNRVYGTGFTEISQNGRAPTRLGNWMVSGLPDDEVETIHDYLKRSEIIM